MKLLIVIYTTLKNMKMACHYIDICSAVYTTNNLKINKTKYYLQAGNIYWVERFTPQANRNKYENGTPEFVLTGRVVTVLAASTHTNDVFFVHYR